MVATDNNEDIDWTKEFDAEPVTFAMMALTELKVDDWSMEFDAEHVHFGQDGLGNFDWSNKADDTPVSLALMATNSEEFETRKRKKELDQVLKERDDFKVKLEKWTNASVLQNEVLNKQRYLSDKSCIGFGIESSSSKESDNSSGDETLTDPLYENFKREKAYKAVPPPTGTIIPPSGQMSTFTGIDELAIRNKVVNQEENKKFNRNCFDSEISELLIPPPLKIRSPKKSCQCLVKNLENRELVHNGVKHVLYVSPDHESKDCNLHERTFQKPITHKLRELGFKVYKTVWNNINRVNHSNFLGSRYPHQKRSFILSAVLTREGLKSTTRPKMTRTVPSKSTTNVFYQGTARPKVPHAALSQSTGRPYYPRMDNIRPRTSSFSPSKGFPTTRTPHIPQRPKKIMKSIWVKKESTIGSQTVLPQNVNVKGNVMIKSTQTWRQKGDYLDSVNRDNGSYTLKQFEYVTPLGVSKSVMTWDKLSDFKEFKGGYVAFGNDSKGGRISGKGTIKTSCLNFEKVSYVEKLKFNLLSFVDEDLVILRARSPQQNDVAERKNRTLIEVARTMLADSLLPIQFWAKAVNNACYVLNRVLVTKPQLKSPYEILMGRSPNISFMRPFGCPLTILNTLDQLGKFDGKSKEGYLLGYSTSSKGFRVYNRVTRKVQDCLHIDFLEYQKGKGGKGSTYDAVEALDDQQFIVHVPSINATQNKLSEERTADKEVPLSSDEQALHDV
ncbi:retrovirus-related pol polyprotein from transposon TNT 1-94 [Tanacetum coccineum]